MLWLLCVVARLGPIPLRRACFQTKHTARNCQALDLLPAYSHIWPKTQSAMVWWGENWGLVGDRCTGEAWRGTWLPVCCLHWDEMFCPQQVSLLVCCPTLISVLISSSLLFLINPSTLLSLSPFYPCSNPPLCLLVPVSLWPYLGRY